MSISNFICSMEKMGLVTKHADVLIYKLLYSVWFWLMVNLPPLGIHSDIAEDKKEYWSSLAPLALEAVLSIGQKARDGTLSGIESYL